MKTKLLLCMALFFIAKFSMAQSKVEFERYHQIDYRPCEGAQQIYFDCSITATNYTQKDSLFQLSVNYGDGTSESFTLKGSFYNGRIYGLYKNILHNYAIGKFKISAFIIAPDGKKDSLFSQVILSDSCDSLKGKVYVDQNKNCVKDANDNVYNGYGFLDIQQDTYPMPATELKNDGSYAVYLPKGYTYTVKPRTSEVTVTSQSKKNKIGVLCPATGDYTVNTLPSTGNDFALNKSIVIDSLTVNGSIIPVQVCDIPYKAYMNMEVVTVGYTNGDITTVHLDFGDGKDTVFTSQVYTYGGQGNSYAYIQHTYTFSGNFSLKASVTGSDGKADTLFLLNQVQVKDSCGNISGYVYRDNNANCQFDGGDNALSNIQVRVEDHGNTIKWAYTDENGKYSFNVPFGNTYDVVFDYQSSLYSSSCPASGKYTVSSLPSADNNYGLVCNNGYDLEAYLNGTRFRPGSEGYMYVTALNNSCDEVDGVIKLVLPRTNLSYGTITPPPASINGDTITWNKPHMNGTNYYNQYFSATVHVNILVSAQIGDSICANLIVEPKAGDRNPADNVVYRCFPVRNSWDPNVKEVFPKGEGASGNISPNKLMTYTIHFQNTGTDTAYNVFILDTLSKNLNFNTLKVVAHSHTVSPGILEGGILKLSFNNIYLADSVTNEAASNGYVTYTIEQKPNLADGTQIKNTADIYFDYNAAVVTNTVVNTIKKVLTGVSEISSAAKVNMYPNPADNMLKVSFTQTQASADVMLMDVLGKLISTTKTINGQAEFNTGNMENGTYLLVVKDGNNVTREKLVIMH